MYNILLKIIHILPVLMITVLSFLKINKTKLRTILVSLTTLGALSGSAIHTINHNEEPCTLCYIYILTSIIFILYIIKKLKNLTIHKQKIISIAKNVLIK